MQGLCLSRSSSTKQGSPAQALRPLPPPRARPGRKAHVHADAFGGVARWRGGGPVVGGGGADGEAIGAWEMMDLGLRAGLLRWWW